MHKCPKCDKEINLGEMGIHEKKLVVCSNCDTKWEVTMHGNGTLFEEVKESPPINLGIPKIRRK